MAALKGVPPPNGGCTPGAHPCNPHWLRGVGGGEGVVVIGGGGNWAVFFLGFRRPRALSDIEQGWGSKGEGLLPFTFGWVARNNRRFEYEFFRQNR